MIGELYEVTCMNNKERLNLFLVYIDLSWDRNQNLKMEIPFPNLGYFQMKGTHEYRGFLCEKKKKRF